MIEHPVSSHEIIYDLCDLDGKIHLSGELSPQRDETNIDLEEIPNGQYHLFIINEGMVFKKLLSFKSQDISKIA